MPRVIPLGLIVAGLVGFVSTGGGRAQPTAETGPAVPIAVAWVGPERLAVALRDRSEIVVIETRTRRVVSRTALGFRPASVSPLEGDRLLVGGMDGEIARWTVASRGEPVQLRGRTGRGPARAAFLDPSRLATTSLWDPTLRILNAADGAEIDAIPLGFAPGAWIRVGEGAVVVTAAFGPRVVRVDTSSRTVRRRTLDGFGLRGLAISPDGRDLLVGHLTQYGTSPLTATNVDWGLILSSRLSALRLTELERVTPDAAELPRIRVTLDGSGHGAADPAALAVSPDGAHVYVALAGANQVARVDRVPGPNTGDSDRPSPLGSSESTDEIAVGRNPVDLAVSRDGRTLATADAMSDSVTLLDLSKWSVLATIPLSPVEPLRTAAQRGEALFVDATLSMDRWMSCSTCHTRGHTAGLNFDTLGDGGYGAAKNTPSLLGNGSTHPFGWTGRFARLEDQIEQSLATSLRGRGGSPENVRDLAAYLRSLPAPPSVRSPSDPLAQRGRRVFQARKCDRCHAGDALTSPTVTQVGLDDGPGGHRAYNPPSLRGVGWTAPYFHDGRAPDLNEVLRSHPPHPPTLSSDDLAALRAYLESR